MYKMYYNVISGSQNTIILKKADIWESAFLFFNIYTTGVENLKICVSLYAKEFIIF